MSEFELFFTLGHRHVLDLGAYDHVLFLGALALTYQVNQWGRLLGLVTIFTLGHTISILIAYYALFQPPVQLVELLIPISIIAASMNNIFRSIHVKYKDHLGVLFTVTLVFGLIHGFGFGRYFNQISDQATYRGFLAFALGIEWAQRLVVIGILLLSYFTEHMLRLSRKDWIVLMSGVIIGLTLPMLLERI